jgi:hypothetical protein
VILVIMGASQVGTSVAKARQSGILDFHRVSPVSPQSMVLGFFFGAPIREYLLFAATLPFSLLCLAMGEPSPKGFAQLMILLIVVAWIFHGLALLNGLISRGPTGARGIVGLVIFLSIMGGNLSMAFARSARFVDEDATLTFFGGEFPWLSVVLLYMGALLFFIFLASVRKIDSERAHPLSKPQAIAFLATFAVLVLGGVWRAQEREVFGIGSLYILSFVSIVATSVVTPSRSEYATGLWRAGKIGRVHLPPWDDLAINRLFLVVTCAIVLAAGTAAWQMPELQGVMLPMTVRYMSPLAIPVAVLTVAYFGLALQFFLLWFGSRGTVYLALFLFLVWLVPVIAGIIIAASTSMPGNDEFPAQIVFALSPLAGIGLATGLSSAASPLPTQAAAITPALLFAFVFNNLVSMARHRADRAVRGSDESAAKAGPFDDLPVIESPTPESQAV